MTANQKRWLTTIAIVLGMFFWVDPIIVSWLWSAFPASAADWGKVIRFILYIPVIVVTFWATLIILGIFWSAAIKKDQQARMDAFKKKHNFPKGW